VYFTDCGLEELSDQRGDEKATLACLAEKMRTFVDHHPGFDNAVERLATFLARDDEIGD
jgi:hypothetical protein